MFECARGRPRITGKQAAMIHFVVQRWHEYTLNNFLDTWGRAIRNRIAVLNYEDLAHATVLRYGTYVFTDHDRLTDAQLALATAIADDLLVNPGAARVLSHPRTTRRRVEFLRAMNEGGVNDFRVFRAASETLPDDVRFPVFLRLANEHKGNLSELLHTRAELDAALAESEHRTSPHLLVVEFCDVSAADGTFRKYGAVRIGDRILPRHVFASKHWMTKLNDDVDRAWIEVEDDYFRRFHDDFEPRLRRIFGLAGVDYGRLDFSLTRDGQIRAWEINTNCMLVTTPDTIHE